MPSIVVFLGPSLEAAEARQLLDAELRPPVKKGDVYGLLTSSVRTIIIIDGIFHNQPSVWPREILAALDEGIEVVGASSMGALRASELHRYGMRGHGTIFEWYRDGYITGDDEVALLHASADHGYRALSEPLVNIRYTLRQATEAGVLGGDEEQALVTFMRGHYYPERSYAALKRSPLLQTWPASRVQELESFIEKQRVNLKARDARAVLELYATRATGARRDTPHVDLWSDDFRYVAFQYRQLYDAGGTGRSWVELAKTVWASQEWETIRRTVVARWFLLDWAHHRGIVCPEEHVHSYEREWMVRHGIDDLQAWCHRRGLTLRECTDLLRARATESWLHAATAESFGLRIPPAFVAELTGQSTHSADRTSLAFVVGWARESGIACPAAERARLFEQWNLQTPARVEAVAREHGCSVSELDSWLEAQCVATWLLAKEPGDFGRTYQVRMAGVHEFQLTTDRDHLLGRN